MPPELDCARTSQHLDRAAEGARSRAEGGEHHQDEPDGADRRGKEAEHDDATDPHARSVDPHAPGLQGTRGGHVVPFGKFAGYLYRETSLEYQSWAVRQAKAGSSFPDLVRYSQWCQEEVAQRQKSDRHQPRKQAQHDPEVNAKEPVPTMAQMKKDHATSSESDAWLKVGDRGRRRKQVPAAAPRPELMSQKIPPDAKEEIAAIEAKLAALKQKHGIAPKQGARPDRQNLN